MSSLLAERSKARLRPMLELNDRVNELTAHERGINATRIVVAGDQSHGKTSVLEALSGVDLPRGEGIKTRVPLVMQLRSCALSGEEYALISGSRSSLGAALDSEQQKEPPERIALDQIAEKVDEYTARLAGDGKDVRDLPISLKVFRHDQDDLTLVDLPGITRVALEGQAGGDGKQLEKLIMEMCRRYMAPKESILLNVVSAMVDFSTSASLQLSRDLDPSGERTALCVTKIDQHHEAGIETKLGAAIVSLKLRPQHVFAVRNRTQAENDDALPLAEALAIERSALEANTELSDGAKERGYGLGVAALSKMLVDVQFDRICKTLPEVGQRIAKQLEALKRELSKLGDHPTGEHECLMLAHQLIDKCSDRLKSERAGRVMTMPVGGASADSGTPGGEMCEVLLHVENLKSLRDSKASEGNYDCVESSVTTVSGGIEFYLSMDPLGEKPRGGQRHNQPVGLYLNCTLPAGVSSASCEYTLACTSDAKATEIKSEDTTDQFDSSSARCFGYPSFLTGSEADATRAPAGLTFSATVLISEVEQASGSLPQPMICAKLVGLD